MRAIRIDSNGIERPVPRRRHRRQATPGAAVPAPAVGCPSGFSLIEVLISGFLVGLIALAVAPMMLLAVQTSAASQEATELTAIGSQQMEVLRGLPFDNAGLVAGGRVAPSDPGYSLDPYLGDANRYLRWAIVDENVERKRIALVVGIRESVWGPAREITMETFRTDIR